MKRIVIHRGPIPGTQIGHHWFTAADFRRYGITSTPRQGGGEMWSYVLVDDQGREVDDSCASFTQIREYAATFVA